MAQAPEPSLSELQWTLATARLIFGPAMSIQSPPNLTGSVSGLLETGANDLGGISPLTPDFVNPEAPWPHVAALKAKLAKDGWQLTERLALCPRYAQRVDDWLDRGLHGAVLDRVDGAGFVRDDSWRAGTSKSAPWQTRQHGSAASAQVAAAIRKVRDNPGGANAAIANLFNARGADAAAIVATANAMRRDVCGDSASYVVNRNINYTNICTYKCGFCAFSKGLVRNGLRERPYNIDAVEIERRSAEAWSRGATEVCLQGGIHPDFTGDTYVGIVRAVRRGAPGIHIHAFSPLEIMHGAEASGLPIREYLTILKQEGLGSLPGTAAEILCDDVRARICPGKISTADWLGVMRAAHGIGLPTTSTIMFGHVDTYAHWAEHLLAIRKLQQDTGGFTEFVPLPFVAAEAPMHRRGQTRNGPTFREALLMHAIARLVFHPVLPNIQTSWVKMGAHGARVCLMAGANDLGGSLMNESITRAAGATHGQEMRPADMEALIGEAGLEPWMRTTLYRRASPERRKVAFDPPELAESVLQPVSAQRRRGRATA